MLHKFVNEHRAEHGLSEEEWIFADDDLSDPWEDLKAFLQWLSQHGLTLEDTHATVAQTKREEESQTKISVSECPSTKSSATNLDHPGKPKNEPTRLAPTLDPHYILGSAAKVGEL